jgi:CHASE2 domain-containing sensor protein
LSHWLQLLLSGFILMTLILVAFVWRKKWPEWIAQLFSDVSRHIMKLWHSIKQWSQFVKQGWHSIKQGRQTVPRFYRKLAKSLVVGLAILWLIMTFQDTALVMNIEDTGMDWLMELREGIIPPLADKDIPGFVLVDINDETYHAWGEPLFTPRNRLTNLIKAAVDAKARMVIVDIDVSQPTPVERSALHPTDQALKNYLADYVTECKAKTDKDEECPSIIFVRAFRAAPDPVPVPRTGFLEEIIAQSAPYLQWASAHFYRAEDQVVRRWQLWQPSCSTDKQPQIVPSIELLAMAMVQNCTTQLQKALQPFQPQNCNGAYIPSQKPPPETVTLCDLSIGTKIRDVNQRIMYSMPWLKENKLPWVMLSQADEEALTVCSALSVEAGTEKDCMARLTDRIVVIGGSYRDGGDVHLTPLDEMPGSLVIINAIHSLLHYEKIEQLPEWGKGLITVILIIIMSLLFARFTSFWGLILSGVFLIFILLPVSIFLFRYGIWLDFALPLIAVQIYRIASDFDERREQRIRVNSS